MKRIIAIASIFIMIGCKTTQINSKSTTMNLKSLHTETKAVQTNVMFEPKDGKVISLQIAKNKQLAEHITKVPALLVCVSGSASYGDESGRKLSLKSGDYVNIEPNVKHWVDAEEESNFLLIK
ncbi:MAG: quercetin dioxygenase-like cupin family protein [Flavobacterium sp.]|jgi:quercetin dioxygenase-like cupin family protein